MSKFGERFHPCGRGFDLSKGRKQPERKPATRLPFTPARLKWNPESEGPIDIVHKTEHPETQSRAEKFVR